MKKLIIGVAAFFLCGSVFSQIMTPVVPTTYGEKKNRIQTDSTMWGPTGCGSPILHDVARPRFAIWYDSCGHRLFVYDPKTASWDSIHIGVSGSGGGGEVNTASNLGGGLANYSSKSGSDLRFNSFLATDFDLVSNVIGIDYTNGQASDGSHKGFLTSSDWTSFNGKVSNATHTGDATGSTALTLATVNGNVGSFTNANITVNAKGLVTAASNGSGGGSTVTHSMGSLYYALNKESTDSIKRLRAGYGITNDSTTHGVVQVSVDSSTIYPQIRATIPAYSLEAFSDLTGDILYLDTATRVRVALTANRSISILRFDPGRTIVTLIAIQDGTGNRTLTINGTLVAIDTIANSRTEINVTDNGDGYLSFKTNLPNVGGNTASAYVLIDIDYISADLGVGKLVNTANVWTADGTSSVFGKTGLGKLKLPSGTDGYIQIQNVSGTGNAFIGFITTNSQITGYTGLLAGFSCSGGDIYKVDNGGFSGTPIGSVGTNDYVRVNRTSGTLTCETSTTGLAGSWTSIYTYSITNNNNLWIGSDIYGNAQGAQYYPKGYKIQ